MTKKERQEKERIVERQARMVKFLHALEQYAPQSVVVMHADDPPVTDEQVAAWVAAVPARTRLTPPTQRALCYLDTFAPRVHADIKIS